jgi:DNA ligase-1
MERREFVMLAQTYVPAKHSIAGWYVSEKLDGMRAIWDGGISRGMLASTVPYANTAKDARLLEPPIATGLWTRYGKVIHAPDWWLDNLPSGVLLDGELYIDRGCFQTLMSTVKTQIPGRGWSDVQYKVFDIPPMSMLFGDGEVKGTNFTKQFAGLCSWEPTKRLKSPVFFSFEAVQDCGLTQLHRQERLPFNTAAAQSRIDELLTTITQERGEGLMLRRPASLWTPKRSHDLLKVKKLSDMEGVVVGYTWGKETDKGSKLLGLMGSVRLRLPNGKEFDLSGFTEDERRMSPTNQAFDEGTLHPGESVNPRFFNPKFPVGSVVTFTYRELTDDGLPKEARYWRQR